MKRNSRHIRNWTAYLLLVLWAATFYPAGLFHHHDKEALECHTSCDPLEEVMDIHHECDHELHLQEADSRCFLCEFTFQNVFIAGESILNSVTHQNQEFVVLSVDSLSLENKEKQAIRGPPLS